MVSQRSPIGPFLIRYSCKALLVCCLLISIPSAAQHLLAVSNGTNDNVIAMFLNPASIGGMQKKITIPVITFNAGIDNNLGTLTSIGNIIGKLKAKKDKSNAQGIFSYSGNTKFSMVIPVAEIRGPGIIYALTDQHSIAFTTRFRMFNQFYNFDKLLYDVAQKNPGQQSVQANMKNFKWTVHAWSEAGFSYAGIIADKGVNQVKIGLTLNLLSGAAYIGMSGNSLNVNYISTVDSFAATNADVTFSTNVAGTGSNVAAAQIIGNMFGRSGNGFGINAGIVWRSRRKNDGRNNAGSDNDPYRFLASLAVTDLGSVTYNKLSETTMKGSGYLRSADLSAQIKDFNALTAYLISRGYKSNTEIKADPVYLPTAINAGIDYNITGGWYANVYSIFNVSNDFNFGNKYYTQVSVSGRFEKGKFSIAVPVTVNTLANSVRVGLGIHAGSFFAGSDDIALLLLNHQYGFNIYFGGYFTLAALPPRE